MKLTIQLSDSEAVRAATILEQHAPEPGRKAGSYVISADTARALREAHVQFTAVPPPRSPFAEDKRLKIAMLIVAIVFVVPVVRIINPLSRPRVNRTTFADIKEGMTLAELQAILGGPPGDYTCGQCVRAWNHLIAFSKTDPRPGAIYVSVTGEGKGLEWTTYEGYIFIHATHQGKVVSKYYEDVESVHGGHDPICWLMGVFGL